MISKDILIGREYFDKGTYKRFLLVADIGGTHASLAVIGVKDKNSYELMFKEKHNTRAISEISYNLNNVLRAAKDEYDIEINTAAFCAAGPVLDDRREIRLTNAELVISKQSILSKTMLTTVALLNDFEAVAYGIDLLDITKDVMPFAVSESAAVIRGAAAVIGPGTGLGMSLLAYDAVHNIHIPFASEGGHMPLMPAANIEWEFYNYLKNDVLKNRAEPDIEMAVSGQGTKNIYGFLRKKNLFPETNTTRRIDSLIGDEKLHEIDISYDIDDTCRKTLDMFAIFYARTAKALALISECYGGLFLCGSITLKLLDVLRAGPFMREFTSHETKSALLKKIPVYIITNKNAALYGCANFVLNY